jgi:hypothetical protein
MPDLHSILDAIRQRPDAEPRWLALAGWLADNGRDDEAAAVRVFWPTLRDDVLVGGSLEATLRHMARHAGKLGRRAHEIEEQMGDERPIG